MIADVLREKPASEWLVVFENAGVPSAPINTIEEAFADPQVLHQKLRIEIPSGDTLVPGVASPMRFSATPVCHEVPPPLLGEHTAFVLRDLLGLDEAEIEDLKIKGVIAQNNDMVP